MQLLQEIQQRIVADNLTLHVDLAAKLIDLGICDSSAALKEVMKQHLWVQTISFKWQCLPMIQKLLSAYDPGSCALARQGALVNKLQAVLASRQSRGMQAAAGMMSLALHNALSSQC